MVSSFTKPIIALGLVAAFTGLTIADADARHRRGHGGHHARGGHNSNIGPAIALGLFGAIAAGAIIHNQHQQRQQQYYYEDQRRHGYAPQGYYQQQQPQYYVQPQRHYEVQYDSYGNSYNARLQRCYAQYPNNPTLCR